VLSIAAAVAGRVNAEQMLFPRERTFSPQPIRGCAFFRNGKAWAGFPPEFVQE
jgi:hypothetical protein